MYRSKVNRRIAVAVGAGVLVIVLGLIGALGPLRWVYDHTVAPVGGGVAQFGSTAGEALGNLSRVKDLAKDNVRLERENAELRQRLAADAETRRDNELLRKQLGLNVASTYRQVSAEVVAFQPDSYRQFVTIDRGSNDGIKAGMAVMSDGMLIGTISAVRSTSAQIMLVTDPEFKLTAKDQDTGATGIIRGQIGKGLLMDKIGQTDVIKPGDTVTTDGLGGVVPAGLFVGRVESVNPHANVVFQTAQVTTNLKVGGLRFAYVVLGLL